MLEEEKTASWKDLPQSQQAKAATRVIKSVEDSAFQLAKLAQAPTVQITVDVNISKFLMLRQRISAQKPVPFFYVCTLTTYLLNRKHY